MAIGNQSDLITRVLQRVSHDGAGHLQPERGDIQTVIDGAILRLSRLSPRHTTDTLSGDGSTYDFALSGLDPSWVSGLSVIEWVEYPADEQQAVILDDSDWRIWPDRLDASASLRFVTFTPASGTDNIRVKYSTAHTVDSSTSTLSDIEDLAAEYFGACAVCEMYATRYAHTTAANLDADAIDFQTRSEEWRTLGEMFCNKGREALGLSGDGGDVGATSSGPFVGAWAEHDIESPYGSPVWRNRSRR